MTDQTVNPSFNNKYVRGSVKYGIGLPSKFIITPFFAAGAGGQLANNTAQAINNADGNVDPDQWERKGILSGAAIGTGAAFSPKLGKLIGSYFLGDMAGQLANEYDADDFLADTLELADPFQVNKRPFWDRWAEYKKETLPYLLTNAGRVVRDFSPLEFGLAVTGKTDDYNSLMSRSVAQLTGANPLDTYLYASAKPKANFVRHIWEGIKSIPEQGRYMWNKVMGD